MLVFGSTYGRKTLNGKSATHLEYDEARRWNLPVFSFILAGPERDPDQARFITEVEPNHFHAREIVDLPGLASAVKQSFLQYFVHCFRSIHAAPPTSAIREPEIQLQAPGEPLPSNARDAFQFLRTLYEQNDNRRIQQLSSDCERLFPNNKVIMSFVYMAEVNLGMNGGAFDQRRIADAIEFWNSNANRARSNEHRAILAYNIGNALSVLKRYPAAIAKYRETLAAHPAYPQCWKNLGTAYVEIGDVRSAVVCFETALEFNPALPEALYSLATIHLTQRNDPERALRYLDQLLLVGVPKHMEAGAQAWKSHALLRLGDYAGGVVCAEKAIRLSPKNLWAWVAAARLYVLLRHQDSHWLRPALSFWERFIDEFPQEAEAWIEFGHVAWRCAEIQDDDIWKQRAVTYYQKGILLGHVTDEVANDRVACGKQHPESGEG